MNPDEILRELERALTLLIDLMQTEGRLRGPESDFKRLVADAAMRLKQSILLLRRFRDAEQRLRTSQREELGDLTFEMRLHGEASYYFAFRVREALGALTWVDGGIDLSFDPVGVREVRNIMIEHPEDHSDKAYVLSWKTDCAEGMVLNPVEGDAVGFDKGLYPNAQEFIAKLLWRTRLRSVCRGS